jgi:hypothetical protein
VEQLGDQNRERARKWIEDHPEEPPRGINSFGSRDELKLMMAKQKKTSGIGTASDDSVLSIWDKKK